MLAPVGIPCGLLNSSVETFWKGIRTVLSFLATGGGGGGGGGGIDDGAKGSNGVGPRCLNSSGVLFNIASGSLHGGT